MAGQWILKADVPDGVVPLAVGELACHSPVLRDTVEDAGVAYLGVVAGARDDRAAVIVLAIAITVMEFPAGTDPASLVAATLRREYPLAVIEEFATASGTGVGMQRRERDRGSGAAVSQVLVPFAGAGLLGAVTGFCFDAEDVEMAMVLTAAIAHRMRVVPG
jgi:hypothetical protein